MQNLKFLNLETNMPDFGLFGLEFENTIVVIEIRALKFFHCQISCKN